MARIRTIKPEFWTSEQVADLSTTARLLFVGMWTFCDDGGVHPLSMKRLKMEVFPGDEFTIPEIESLFDEIFRAGLIQKFRAGENWFFVVNGWHHQKIEKPRYLYPKFEDADEVATHRRPVDDQSTTHRPCSLRESSLRESTEPPPKSPLGDSAKRTPTKQIRRAFELWNETASRHPKLSTAAKLTQERSKKLRARIAEEGWFEKYQLALAKIPVPSTETFTWQPDFDWMIRNDTNVYKILEGKYDRNGATQPEQASNQDLWDRAR